LNIDPKPKYTNRAIYRLWAKQDRKKWRRHDDEVISAQKLLSEAENTTVSNGLSKALPIKIPNRDGFVAIAWAVPELLQKWGGQLREIALDSACKPYIFCSFYFGADSYSSVNTNASHFELYALLGEVYGSGTPLGFLCLQTPADAHPGGKQHYIEAFLQYFRIEGKLTPSTTLTDKDLSEINAFRSQFPDAHHQLCYWHALRAVKKRLSILRRQPAYYNVENAHSYFPWISPTSVPINQSSQSNLVSTASRVLLHK
jgi:hypothetical protein